jgi:hypothetical protein
VIALHEAANLHIQRLTLRQSLNLRATLNHPRGLELIHVTIGRRLLGGRQIHQLGIGAQ